MGRAGRWASSPATTCSAPSPAACRPPRSRRLPRRWRAARGSRTIARPTAGSGRGARPRGCHPRMLGGSGMTRIGVLTGGGDVPGLNACIKTLVYGAVERGYEVIGLRRGWAGLLDYDLDAAGPQDQCVQPLSRNDVRTIDRTGGTFLHTSRTNPGTVKPRDVPAFLAGQGQAESEGPFDFTNHCLRVVERLGLDWLVPIGGDHTLSYGERAGPGGGGGGGG